MSESKRSQLYTADLSGSGQFGKCAHCKKHPDKNGHDGCLGELDTSIVMNACCGHGKSSGAYVQYWGGSCVRGDDAVEVISKLKKDAEVSE